MIWTVLTNEQWIDLETDIRRVLDDHHVDETLWLVHDLLVACRCALDDANLTTYDRAAAYYRAYPEKLHEDLKPPAPLVEPSA